MKLIFAVINNDDSHEVSTELTKNGFPLQSLLPQADFSCREIALSLYAPTNSVSMR